ncbi:DUF4280 domain-containing protein [Apibacter muscae]|uniref:PAAR-like protein n=1 Tax=Apibacter muscae TaxID=2509004 RepID=UPI0011AC0AA6|nr:PAAR-like protein [Apibacter muscae]TWP23053.1 DUF4280 domain-containing protein [Apibacter muscae]
MSKKYIPENSWLTCDKGATPIKIKVTHNNNSYLYGEKLVSEMDMIPGENIGSFGSCALCGSCAFQPIYWDKCNEGVKVNGFKLVFEDANLLCKKGGKIKVDFNVPVGAMVANAAPWLNYNDVIDYNQRGVIHDVENGKINFNDGPSGNSYNTRTGNYGEMKDQVYHRENGWRDIKAEHPNMNIDKPTASGIDGAYEKGGFFKETDAKYNTATLRTNPGSGNRELDINWTNDHIDRGAIANQEDARAMKRANNNGTLQREVTHIDTNGTMKSKPMNDQAYRQGAGSISDIEIKPLSKANNLINSARSSLRNSRPIQSLANSGLSKTVQNSAAAKSANNALWKATQTVEASSALKTTGKVVGKGLIVVGIAAEGYNVYSTYQQEGEFGPESKKALGGAFGSVAMGYAGAEVGAVIGTAICPGIGTVVGGVVGGAVGAIAGSSVGRWIGSWFK